jgi:DNA-binding NtrC family response regulator
MIQSQAVGEAAQVAHAGPRPTLKDLMESYERGLIRAALEATAGNQRRAAAALGLLPTTLHEKMKRLGMIPKPARDARPETSGSATAA